MEESASIHVLVFPWLAFGHIIPFLELTKALARRGHRATFVSTPRNIDRLPELPPNLAPMINLVKLTLPHVDGLPDDAEATTDVPLDQVQYLKKAMDGLEEPMSALLDDITPDWIIHDFNCHWILQLAAKSGIPCAHFSTNSAATVAILGQLFSAAGDKRATVEKLTKPPSWVPFSTSVALRPYEAMQFFLEASAANASGLSDAQRAVLTFQQCQLILLRSCVELEGGWLKLAEQILKRSVIPVGVLPPTVQEISNKAEEHVGKKWLDKQANGSTLYIAFGSEARPSKEHLHELAHGIELSELPFIWVLRSAPGETSFLPEGFEDRTKDRGLVHMGWVPQIKILAHPSIGGFLTHGGCSSIIEGLAFGKPLIVFPFMIDQLLNARLIEEKKVGVEVPRNEQDGSFFRDAVAKTLRLVMVKSEGEQIRVSAKAMKEIFGSHKVHDPYIDNVVRNLKEHKCQNGRSGSLK